MLNNCYCSANSTTIAKPLPRDVWKVANSEATDSEAADSESTADSGAADSEAEAADSEAAFAGQH